MAIKDYHHDLYLWRANLDKSIRNENGWLALAGIFWLEPGKSLFGSDPKCEVRLPIRLADIMGYFEYNGKTVSLYANMGEKVNVNGGLVDFAILQPDTSDNPSYIDLEDTRLVVIEREGRLGIRMWDNLRKERQTFPARTWFDIDESFRVQAAYTPYDHPKQTYFPDITGKSSESQVEGFLTFEIKGAQYQLDVNKEDDDTLFIRFWDQTSRNETYPSGRYLTVNNEEEGELFLDFNKAYSPPCAFTAFGTCVFAPEQNRLNLRVTAGETYSLR